MSDEEKLASPKRLYIFIRKDGFYPITLPEATVADNAAANPGTVKVILAETGDVVWQP